MRLYIAEKPSMGREIAKCLKGPLRSHDGWLETADGAVTWGFGHILRQKEPEEYSEKYKFWRVEDLPIVPAEWQLVVASSAARQFRIVKDLIARADEIVHAGDPDREGQLLIDEVLDFVGNQKPVKRILLNALDEKSIREANANLRENSDFYALKQSALARARADWLIGMNLSRAYTLAARRAGHKRLVLPVGRVKTPTLALVVRREREIEGFKPVDYFELRGKFCHADGEFSAVWKPREEEAGLDREGRLVDAAAAKARLLGFAEPPTKGRVTDVRRTKKTEGQRLPFSLSSLQVLSGRKYGYEPQLVLDTAQKLYEKKLTTYPRSDSEYLPLNQRKDAPAILTHLRDGDDAALSHWAGGADAKIKSRAWNDKKVTAHHAIIPTTVRARLGTLTETEQNIYRLIAQAFIAQFYPEHIYEQTRATLDYHGEVFTANGRRELQAGWRALYRAAKKGAGEEAEDGAPDGEEEGGGVLPPLKKDDLVTYAGGALKKRETKPPPRFTPATLLQGMKEIHKYVLDPEAKKRLKDVYGIGTEATRAAIIDDLIKRRFLTAKGKKKLLYPTDAAYLLIDALPDDLVYPDATALWEDKLHSMADGAGTLEEFLAAQVAFTRRLVAKALDAKIEREGEHPCPRCKNGVLIKRSGKNGDFWGCSNYPRCRMSCDDKDGKPKLNTRIGGAAAPKSASSPRDAAPRANRTAARPASGFGAPVLSEAEMAAFLAEYAPLPSAQQIMNSVPKNNEAAGK
ncbi:DNA topoisomerase 3 [Selenomonas sp.]|uniref:DNA topoisomerase 3 n=1 Tax=Selenomonas sp. TaxID=2053611 RepID=UPI003FA2F39A